VKIEKKMAKNANFTKIKVKMARNMKERERI